MGWSRIRAIDRVRLEASPEVVDGLRWFYGEVAGLEADLASSPGRLCFKSGRIELTINLVDRPKIERIARVATISVRSLAEVGEMLDEAGVPYDRSRGLSYTDRRIWVHDPAGNRVELKQEWPVVSL